MKSTAKYLTFGLISFGSVCVLPLLANVQVDAVAGSAITAVLLIIVGCSALVLADA